jgi:hypothetical protein
MSKPRPTPSPRLTCADVRFVEVDFPRQIRPRLVIEFSEGLSLLLEDPAAVPRCHFVRSRELVKDLLTLQREL